MSEPRTFIKLHDGIADHPKIEPLSDAAFRLLVTSWCWCHKHNTDGFMPAAVWGRRGTPKARRELLDGGLVLADGGRVEFRDYLKEQRSAEQRQAALEQRRSAGRAGGLARAKRTASDSLSDSPSETQAEVEKEKEKSMSAAADAPIRSDVEGLCRYFVQAIAKNGAKGTITERWRTEARLLLDRDECEPTEIRAVIDWSTSDAFWKANILSVPKLREKYVQLRLAMQRERPSLVGDPHKEHLAQW